MARTLANGELEAIPARITHADHKRLSAEQLETVRKRLHERHPDDDFTAPEAAIYLRCSVRTITRAIEAGLGPPRGKNPGTPSSSALNHHTRFPKSGLDSWREKNRNFEPATGTFKAFEDLTRDEPWIFDGERVVGHLLDAESIEAALDLLAEMDIRYLRLDEALLERWISVGARRVYEAHFTSAIEAASADIDSARQRDELDAGTAKWNLSTR